MPKATPQSSLKAVSAAAAIGIKAGELPLRRHALDILSRVQSGALAAPLLHATFRRQEINSRDAAWLTELVLGTLRQQDALDAALAPLLRQPLRKLPPPVLICLRLGAYQLLHMRTPAYSAVDGSVALVRKRFGRVAGVVNAVLRKLSVAEPAAALAPLTAQTLPDWAARYSHPLWFAEALLAQLGPVQTQLALQASNERPPLHLRVNTRKISRAIVLRNLQDAGHSAAEVPHLPQALSVAAAGDVTALPGFAEGHFVVQDGAAQAVSHMLAPTPGSTVLDACAAPGGKTTHLLELMDDSGTLLALDHHPGRMQRLTDNAERLGLQAYQALVADASDALGLQALLRDHLPATAAGKVQFALLDAPCSGMGTLRRHPELRQKQQSTLADLLVLQRQLLHSVANVLAPGGVLVYAVCSPLAAEGPQQVAAFLAERDDFQPAAMPEALQSFAQDGALCTWPHQHGTDAFYAIRLVRQPAVV